MDTHRPSDDVMDEVAMAVLPERGLVISEMKQMQLQLCKPKLLPIKSYSLEKLEKMEKKLAREAKEKRDVGRAQRQAALLWTSPDLTTGEEVKSIPAPLPPGMGTPAPLPKVASSPLRDGCATPPSATSAAASSASSRGAVSQETLSSLLEHTEEEAGDDAPRSAPESSSRMLSRTNISSSSSSPPGPMEGHV
ncbi:Cilia BBSome complex subunit 10, putative [Leishmania lindenbergi]|uniref:Cilia BBSome complex subunit 10 n=1 Tax=Leishmania lindenbergi TaxID=651832 RepID=A0AAW3AMS1_9TRYP